MQGREKQMLPDYPRTRHLPHKARPGAGDSVAPESEAKIIFTASDLTVEGKIDGSQTGMCLSEGHPIIRNRSHILNKAFTQRKTAARMQFASIFGWFYENMWKFETLNERLGYEAAVYGEWMYAVHGMEYDVLPDLWIPYDIYDWQQSRFLPSSQARSHLAMCGFTIPQLLHAGPVQSYEQLEAFCQEKDWWSSEKREGVYIKVNDAERMVARFKMVREGFQQGARWSDSHITKNKVIRS
jgi:RNA ligase